MTTRKPDEPLRFHPRQGQPVQPTSAEQSGSTGRHTGKGDLGQDKNTGQDLYGQSGLGGKTNTETIGQRAYKQGPSGSEQKRSESSNRGSGRAVDESENATRKGQKPSRR